MSDSLLLMGSNVLHLRFSQATSLLPVAGRETALNGYQSHPTIPTCLQESQLVSNHLVVPSAYEEPFDFFKTERWGSRRRYLHPQLPQQLCRPGSHLGKKENRYALGPRWGAALSTSYKLLRGSAGGAPGSGAGARTTAGPRQPRSPQPQRSPLRARPRWDLGRPGEALPAWGCPAGIGRPGTP